MSRLELIKSYFLNNSEKFDLKVKNGKDVSVITYAVNQEEYGMQNIFIADRTGFKYLLKKSRHDRFDKIYRQRMAELRHVLQDNAYNPLRPHMVIGEELEISGEHYLLFNYVNIANCYKRLRLDIFQRNILPLLEQALEFCLKLERTAKINESAINESRKIWELFKSSYAHSESKANLFSLPHIRDGEHVPNIAVNLVHNDFGPSNILEKDKNFWVVDWEYWNISMSIFNFFDVLLSFASLMNNTILSKRVSKDFLSIFTDESSKKEVGFTKKCGEYADKMGYLEYAPEVAEKLFITYLMNKAVCQQRIYGSHYGFDTFWYQLLVEYSSCRQGFRSYWQQMARWKRATNVRE